MTQFKQITLLGFMFILVNFAHSETSKVGTTAAQFLKIGVGARAVAMGEAFSGQANDVSALFWNPAGLTQLQHREALFSYSQWLASLQYSFAGIALPLSPSVGTLGFFASFLSTPEDVVRTIYQPEGTGETFQSTDMALGLAYARKLTPQLSVGGNVKYIRQSIWHMSGSSWAIDFGGLFQSDFKNLRLGINIANFGAPLRIAGESSELFVDHAPDFDGNVPVSAELSTTAWELPLLFRAGLALDLLSSRTTRLTLASEFNHPGDNHEFINAGCEYAFKEMFFLRTGYRGLGMNELEGGLTAGAGTRLAIGPTQLTINYAFVDYGRLNATHRYELAFTF